jgi:hypothetical protein
MYCVKKQAMYCVKKKSGDPLSDVGGSTPEGISRSTAIMYIYHVTATRFLVSDIVFLALLAPARTTIKHPLIPS